MRGDEGNGGWGPEEVIIGLLILEDIEDENQPKRPKGREPQGCSLSIIVITILFVLLVLQHVFS